MAFSGEFINKMQILLKECTPQDFLTYFEEQVEENKGHHGKKSFRISIPAKGRNTNCLTALYHNLTYNIGLTYQPEEDNGEDVKYKQFVYLKKSTDDNYEYLNVYRKDECPESCEYIELFV